LRPGVYKPIETGCTPFCHDGNQLLKRCQEVNESFKKFGPEDIITYSFALPAAPVVAKDRPIQIKPIIQAANRLQKECDILFIEGAGGLMVPISCDLFMIDLIELLKAKALLVCPSRLGSINDTLLSRKALGDRKIDYRWYINLFEDAEDFWHITAPYYTMCGEGLPTQLESVFDSYFDRYGA
jgi:dethiobiotin synthetase